VPTERGRSRPRQASRGGRNGPGRPSISPLVWVAVAVWAASRAGTELAVRAWQTSDRAPLFLGGFLVVSLLVAAIATRRTIVTVLGIAAALAMGAALAHGAWLADTASALDSSVPGSWSATVASDPHESGFGTDVIVRLDGVPGSPAVRVAWPGGTEPPSYGQRMEMDTRLRAAVRLGDGSADSFRTGVILSASPWAVRVAGWSPGPFGAICAWRRDSVEAVRGHGGAGAEALASMLFGTPVQGDGVAALEDARTAGVGWAIVASGLHLGVIVLLAERLAGALGAGRRGRATFALVALAVVSAAAGVRLSLLRAALAATAAVLARLVGRRRDATAALGGALALLMIVDPAAAYDAGLALGAAAVMGVALLSSLARTWLVPVMGGRAAGVLAGSASAQVAVVPLAAGMFGAVSLAGPVTLAVSAAPVQAAVAFGAAGAVLAPVSPQVGGALSSVGVAAAYLATRVWQVVAGVPGVLLTVPAPPWWLAAAWVACGAALWLRWPTPRRAARVRLGVCGVAVAVICATAFATPVSGCIEVLNVGQGDAILVRDAGQTVLVDTGPDPLVLRQALARAGVHSLDGLVLTHAHADHTGGLDGLAGVARPHWIAVPDVKDDAVSALADRAASDTDSVLRLHTGMEFSVGSVKVRVLWPRGGETGLAANDTSVILLLEKDGHRALLLGDAEEQAQRGALEAWSGTVEMMKVAHHGSVNGAVPSTLAVWRPAVALISVGRGNPFGHPAPEALAALAGAGAVVHRTDLEGDLGWDPAPALASPVSGLPPPLCDNRGAGRPATGLPLRGQVDAWPLPVSTISGRSISSTARRSCCWSAPRSGCTTGSQLWRTSTSTMRRSTEPRPPPTTWSTPPTPCPS
jgi:competence protein ComEC